MSVSQRRTTCPSTPSRRFNVQESISMDGKGRHTVRYKAICSSPCKPGPWSHRRNPSKINVGSSHVQRRWNTLFWVVNSCTHANGPGIPPRNRPQGQAIPGIRNTCNFRGGPMNVAANASEYRGHVPVCGSLTLGRSVFRPCTPTGT